MSIAIKKIGKKKYAYYAFRVGERVVHKYLGSIEDQRVKNIIRDRANNIPEFLEALFWDTDPRQIGLKKNYKYIIERVLEYGNIHALLWLQEKYTVRTIVDILELSRGISEKSKNFWTTWFKRTADAY
ncbi:MAG: hypothetical protein HY072_00190 [Deltaproteobacteria bacterium]|nr:hypothetical protein [Deltaproteobacteria bacterium]